MKQNDYITIVRVDNRRLMKKFIAFPKNLYKGCDNWVPALDRDEYDTFNREKNGAFDFCDSDSFLALRGREIVGRVTAILNRKANEIWNLRAVRFGWLDFIEDINVLAMLLDTVEKWGKERGCECITGPWGFTDFDREGLLVEGFERLSSFTCLYNYPYYGTMLEQLGYRKYVDWTQEEMTLAFYPQLFRLADSIEKRSGVRMVSSITISALCRKYGKDIFRMLNRAFAPLTGFSPFNDRQVETLLRTYSSILDTRFIALCVDNDDKPVGFVACAPSLAAAIKKSGGRLFPFGIFRIFRALRKNDTLEWLICGVDPSRSGDGTVLLLMKNILDKALQSGIKRIVFNPHLEDNVKAGSLLKHFKFDTQPYTRRRCYLKECQ